MEFIWNDAAIIASDVPKTIKADHWKAAAEEDNSTPTQAREVKRIAESLGFTVTGIAAEPGNPNGTEMTLPLELVEPVTGSTPLNYQIRTVSQFGYAQISNVAKLVAVLKDPRRGNNRNRVHGVVDILMGEETGAGGNAAGQLSDSAKDALIPGVTRSVESHATSLIGNKL